MRYSAILSKIYFVIVARKLWKENVVKHSFVALLGGTVVCKEIMENNISSRCGARDNYHFNDLSYFETFL